MEKITRETKLLGTLILHPSMWGVMKMEHPTCNVCGLEIFPLTPVEIEGPENNLFTFFHADCWEKKEEEPKGGETG